MTPIFYRLVGVALLALGAFTSLLLIFDETGKYEYMPSLKISAVVVIILGVIFTFAPQEQEADPTKARPSLPENQQDSEQEQKK